MSRSGWSQPDRTGILDLDILTNGASPALPGREERQFRVIEQRVRQQGNNAHFYPARFIFSDTLLVYE